MSAHTPGPWEVEPRPSHLNHSMAVSDRRGHAIAKVEHQSKAVAPEIAANLRLIAAAPDLLDAACEALRVLVDETQPRSTACQMLRAALAKAKGQP